MALAPQTAIGRIDPGSLIGQADPNMVSPRAVSVLADAFRTGQISANDIHDRVSERAKAKEKMEITLANRATAEASDPALIEARRQQMLAAGAQGQLAGAQATAGLANVDEIEQLKLQMAQNAAQVQKYPMSTKFPELAAKYSVPTPRNPDGSLNYAALSDLGAKLVAHDAKIEAAKSEWNAIGKTTSADGSVLIGGITPQGDKLDEAQLRAKEAATKESFFKIAPGAVAAPAVATPGMAPTTPDLRSTGEGDAGLVQPLPTPARAPLPTVSAEVPPAGTVLPGGNVSLGAPKQTAGAGGDAVKMTGEQATLIGRSTFTRDLSGQLQTAYDQLLKDAPWYAGDSARGRFGKLTLAEERNPALSTFRAKASGILAPLVKGIYGETGVLSEKDIERYQPNIPSPNDTPEVARSKIQGLNEVIHTSIVNNINAMDLQKQNLDPRIGALKQVSLEALAKIDADKAAGIAPATPGAAPAAPAAVKTLSTGRKVTRDAQGNPVLVK